jgi:hypothetical protein
MASFVKDKAGAEDLKFKDSGTEKATFTRENQFEGDITLDKIDAGVLQFRSLGQFVEGILDGSVAIKPSEVAFAADQKIQTSTGTPEGAIASDRGALALDTTGGTYDTLFFKTTDTVNTGWKGVNSDANTVDGFDTGDGAAKIPVLTAGGVLSLANATSIKNGDERIYTGAIGGSPIEFYYDTISYENTGPTAVGAVSTMIEETKDLVNDGGLYMFYGTYHGTKGGTNGLNTLELIAPLSVGQMTLYGTTKATMYEYNGTPCGGAVMAWGTAGGTGFTEVSLRLTSAGSNTTVDFAAIIMIGPLSLV